MTVWDGTGAEGAGAGVDGAGGAGEVASGVGGGVGPGAAVAVRVTVCGVSGAGVSVPCDGGAAGRLSGELLGSPGEFDGSGECGTPLGRGDGDGDGGCGGCAHRQHRILGEPVDLDDGFVL